MKTGFLTTYYVLLQLDSEMLLNQPILFKVKKWNFCLWFFWGRRS